MFGLVLLQNRDGGEGSLVGLSNSRYLLCFPQVNSLNLKGSHIGTGPNLF